MAEKQPNAWGLHDTLGNVWEWCSDWWAGDYYKRSPEKDPPGAERGDFHVMRGGAWWTDAQWLRASSRKDRIGGDYYIGFRVVCEGSAPP